MGILSLLDEESLFPKATDITFVNKLHAQFDAKGHPKYIKPRFSKTAFGIAHYAGALFWPFCLLASFWFSITADVDKEKRKFESDVKQLASDLDAEVIIIFCFQTHFACLG